jgi:hypothetical protein
VPIGIPSYEEAHRTSDTIIARPIWDAAQADLRQLDALFQQLAAAYSAAVRSYRGPKHPYPCRELVKRRSGETRFAGIMLDPSSSIVDRHYSVGVSVVPRGWHALWRRGEWTHLGTVSACAVEECQAEVFAVIRESATRAFGALEQAV